MCSFDGILKKCDVSGFGGPNKLVVCFLFSIVESERVVSEYGQKCFVVYDIGRFKICTLLNDNSDIAAELHQVNIKLFFLNGL